MMQITSRYYSTSIWPISLMSLDVPVDFSFDLCPLQNFRSDSLVQLTGGTGLSVTLGIDLNRKLQVAG